MLCNRWVVFFNSFVCLLLRSGTPETSPMRASYTGGGGALSRGSSFSRGLGGSPYLPSASASLSRANSLTRAAAWGAPAPARPKAPPPPPPEPAAPDVVFLWSLLPVLQVRADLRPPSTSLLPADAPLLPPPAPLLPLSACLLFPCTC